MRKFLESEYLAGRIPAEGLPLQSGVGNVANAVLASVGQSTIIPPFKMHTEVLQDTVVELMKQGRCLFASSCCIHVCDATLQEIYRNFDFYRDKILLRPVEVSNNPAIARRIGLICMNTALEVDIFGNVNSTHIAGTHIMNDIGGSGDFARSSAYTIFSCPSIAKGGAISSVVPMVSHTDHTEHDVHVIITEQGVADLRGLSPRERAEVIIENCAHPDYRPMLRKYLARTTKGHTPHDLRKAFSFHNAFTETGDMRNANLD
jgi:acyl-CoA hydrolase